MLRARDAMDRAYSEPLNVRAVAAVAHVSEAHFSRTFRAVFGETPHRYLRRRRVERSMFLLRETDRRVTETEARTSAGHANAAARDLRGAPRHAAYAAGQAAAVAHVAAHELGAAAYAIRAVQAAAEDAETAGRAECRWQREQLPGAIRDLVLDDQRLRNELCWYVFDC